MKTFWVLLLVALFPLTAWAGTPGPGSKADANTVNAGPTSGSAALPTYRTLVSGDVAEAVSVKAPVRVATTTSGTLATSFENGDTVDGVTLATGDRILVKDQASASENGIRIVAASGAPARATDADSSAELPLGLTVAVKAGTTNGGKVYLMTANADPVVVNTSTLTFTAVSGSGISDGDKGDITVSGTGSTFTIDNTAVTFAKIQNVATDRLVGRDTASSGSVEELTVGGGIEFTGSAGIQRSALTGDVTASAGSNSTTIANNAVTTAKILDENVTYAKIANGTGLSVIGRSASSAGVNADIVASTSRTFLNYNGTSLGFRALSGVRSISSTDTVVAGDSGKVLLCNASTAFTLSLTAAATLGDGFIVTIVKTNADTNTSTGALTIDPNGTETINGTSSNQILYGQYASLTLVCDGSNWQVVDANDYISVESTSGTDFPSSGTWGDLGSFSLPPGEWEFTGVFVSQYIGGTFTEWKAGVAGTASGNSGSGLTAGSNLTYGLPATSAANYSIGIAGFKVSQTSSTTKYAKISGTWVTTAPKYYGRMSARRYR